jgi:integrase
MRGQEIRQTEEGTFRLYWKDDSGKTRSRPVPSSTTFEPTVDRRKGPRRLAVSDMLDQYCLEHRVADPERRDNIVKHLKAFFGSRAVEDIDIVHSREYAEVRRSGKIGGGAKRKDKTGSDATIKRELAVLHAAAKHALRWKRILAMPSIEYPHEKLIGYDDEASYYSREELARIFWAASQGGGELEHFVKLLYYTGARRASIENLRRSQVNWETRRITLQLPGKITTKKRQPIVPILKKMEAPLHALWLSSPNERLFQRADFYAPYRELLEGLGMADRANPHCMRHTRASHLLQEGKSVFDVAKLLGDTIQTVERVYGHHSAACLAERLDD